MKAGYARCSTNESRQDIERQVRELKQAGAETVYLEYEHGDAAVKEQLSLLLEQAQAGDTIITLEVSRLARSTKQLCEIIEAPVPCHCRQYHNGLPQRTRRPNDRGVFANGRRVQSVGACYDTGAGALRNGKRKSQGQADRQAAPDQR